MHGAMMYEYGNAVVTLVERPDQTIATIAWCDPTTCRYGNQTWRLSRARVKGVCAMSGSAIFPNDSVYKPSRCRPLPANAQAMILAAVIDSAADLLQ
jgi:hypothetical protein